MKIYLINGKDLDSLPSLYRAFGEAVNGENGYFGENLDALSDCLSGGFGTPENEDFIFIIDQAELITLAASDFAVVQEIFHSQRVSLNLKYSSTRNTFPTDDSTELSLSITIAGNFGTIVEETRKALANNGFGILTEIDLKQTLKTKLDVNLPPYVILGACNPPLAHRAVSANPQIGLLLPCNVVVRESTPGKIIIDAINPNLMVNFANETATAARELKVVSQAATEKLQQTLDALTALYA